MADFSEEHIKLPDKNSEAVLRDVLKEYKFRDCLMNVTNGSVLGDNYMGVIYRINVKGTKENGSLEEISFIMKLPPPSKFMREKLSVANLYKREVFAYNVLFPAISKVEKKFLISKDLKFLNVKCYKAIDTPLKELLLFEDMAVKGFNMYNKRESLDYKHLKLVIQSLANFHGLTFYVKELDEKKYREMSKALGDDIHVKKELSQFLDLDRDRALDAIVDEVHKEKLTKFGKNMYEKYRSFLKSIPEKYTVLCHGDAWINNFLFKYDGAEPIEVRLLDWQVMMKASPVTDLAYLFFTSTDEKVRKGCFHDMMDFYHECLKKKLASMNLDVEKCYPKTVFKDHLKKVLPYGMVAAILVLPVMMNEKGDVQDVETILGKDKPEMTDVAFGDQKSANRYNVRMNGVVRDMVNYNLI